MNKVVLILELAENQRDIMHEVHASWETAVATIRETYSTLEGVQIDLGPRRVFGVQTRQPIKVTYVKDTKKKVVEFVLTEMEVQTEVSHL